MLEGGRDILLSTQLGAEGTHDLYKSLEDPQLAFTEGDSGTVLMRGTGGIREEREDRDAETTDDKSDLSFDSTSGCLAKIAARERGANEDLIGGGANEDLTGEEDLCGEVDLLATEKNVAVGEAGDDS